MVQDIQKWDTQVIMIHHGSSQQHSPKNKIRYEQTYII
jgi:hypothetical protein